MPPGQSIWHPRIIEIKLRYFLIASIFICLTICPYAILLTVPSPPRAKCQKDSGLKKTPAPASPRFDFNKAARKAVKDHPQLKGRTLFISAANDDFTAIENKLLDLDVDDEDIEELGKTMRIAKRDKTSFHQPLSRTGYRKQLSAIVFHTDKHAVYGPVRGAVDDAATFDHETAHALTPEFNGTLAESAADCYAALRHLQREKSDDGALQYAAWKRAAISLLSGTVSHLTTPALDQLLLDAKTVDVLSLTPAETLALAKKYAQDNTPPAPRLKKLADDFNAVRGTKGAAAFRKIAEITLAADAQSDTFKYGARVLQHAIGRDNLTLDGKKVALKGPEWQQISRRLTQKAQRRA